MVESRLIRNQNRRQNDMFLLFEVMIQQGHFGQIRLEFQTVLFYFPVTNFSSAAL